MSLLYGIDRRSGPLWIAIAASLRATPILFAFVYLARREWWRFWMTVALTLVLVAPMLWYDPASLITGVVGREPGLLAISSILYVAVAVASVIALGWLALRRSRYTMLAAAAAAVLASPKLFGYDVTTLLAVNPHPQDPDGPTNLEPPQGSHGTSST